MKSINMLTFSVHLRNTRTLAFAVFVLGLASALMLGQSFAAQENSVTAIDIALEPDATMIDHAKAANARLRESFPEGFALDATHHPHVTMLQQFVRTSDLDKVYTAVNAVLAKEKPRAWPTPDLRRLQNEIIAAVEPYTAKTGTPAAFFSEAGGKDIQQPLIEYVTYFTKIAAGEHFNPHVTIGVAREDYLKKMLAEPFESFTFYPTGASVYQLGTFGTARKELKALTLAP
jgi:2'-5' RNA ligase